MALKLFNTLSKTKEDFSPRKPKQVSLYTCGPTVYDLAHIGNFRSFIFSDILRRHLEYSGYLVTQVINITDIDDKIIKKSQTENIPTKELTEKYENILWQDFKSLNILPPHQSPRATEYIKEMEKMIQILLDKDIAYKTDSGIYFNINKYESYGKLADIKITNEIKSRITQDNYDKENIQDFALWKFWKPEDGDVFWDSSLGKGRPGWHIECSAMSTSILGDSIDIHTGGIDLIFPHHTNEIAQSECATGKEFVKYWLHSGFVNIESEKMSKSLGNIITLQSLNQKNIKPLSYRYWLLTSHYKTTINFTWDSILGAQEAYKKLNRFVSNKQLTEGSVNNYYLEKSLEALDDDLNTAKVIGFIWELIADQNIKEEDKKATILELDKILGLKLNTSTEIPKEILDLVKEREQARKNNDFTVADQLRKQIESMGYVINDTKEGTEIEAN